MAEPTVVAEFELGAKGTVRACLTSLGGKQYVDCRLWVEPRDRPGAPLIPTKAGLCFAPDYLPDLRDILERLQRHLDGPEPKPAPRALRTGYTPDGIRKGHEPKTGEAA